MCFVMAGMSGECTSDVVATQRAFCPGCGYALRGLESRQCPECGRGFDPGDPRSFAKRPPRPWVWKWGRRVPAVLLLLILLAGAGLEWLRRGWRAEQNAIASVQRVEGKCILAPMGPAWLGRILPGRWSYLRDRVQGVQLQSLQREQIDRLDLRPLSYVESFRSSFCVLNGKNLDDMGHWTRLNDLTIKCARFEGRDMAGLGKFPGLTRLSLRGVGFGQEGLAPLAALKRLRALDLSATRTSDQDLRSLRGLTALEELDLAMTQVTNRGLEQLKDLQSLRVLKVQITGVTPAGAAELQKAIPGLRIITK